MKIKRRYILYGIVLFFIGLIVASIYAEIRKPKVRISEDSGFKQFVSEQNHDTFVISQPYTYRNLEVFLIHSASGLKCRTFTSLQTALKEGLIKVYESEIINSMYIDNATDQAVFINSGEILKGGKQDRAVQKDVIVPLHVSRYAVTCFCVEERRWSQRSADESAKQFKSSTKMIAGGKLKKSLVVTNSQFGLWSSISEYQNNVNANLMNFFDVRNADVTKNNSYSSLELTLDNPALNKVRDEIKRHLGEFTDIGKANGMAVVINGNLVGLDLYNSSDLFSKLFDKLLESAIYESIESATDQEEFRFDANTIDQILKSDNQLQSSDRKDRNIAYETYYSVNGFYKFISIDRYSRQWVHQSFIFDQFY